MRQFLGTEHAGMCLAAHKLHPPPVGGRAHQLLTRHASSQVTARNRIDEGEKTRFRLPESSDRGSAHIKLPLTQHQIRARFLQNKQRVRVRFKSAYRKSIRHQRFVEMVWSSPWASQRDEKFHNGRYTTGGQSGSACDCFRDDDRSTVRTRGWCTAFV
jgi:hypothetical protein